MDNKSLRISSLDLARGFAALAVCAGHLRAAIFVDYSQLESSNIFQKIFYAMTGLGHEAVMIFFVLSGFLVGGSVLKKRESFEWLKYGIARLTRLWVVLIPALFLTLIVDRTIEFFHPEVFTGTYSQIWSSGPVSSTFSLSLDTFIKNILFQQTIFTTVYGSNSPIWSLANEFYYYVFFPALMLSIGYLGIPNKIVKRIFFGFAVVAIFTYLPSGFAGGFIVFCMGAFVNLLMEYSSRFKASIMTLMIFGFIAFISSIYLSKSSFAIRYFSGDMVVGLGFSILLIALTQFKLNLMILRKVSAFVADMSYSLYLTHFPIVILIAASCYGKHQLKPDAIGICLFFAWQSLLLLIAVIFWFMFERHTDFMRHEILSLCCKSKKQKELR